MGLLPLPRCLPVHRAVGCALLACLTVAGLSGQTTPPRPRRVLVLPFENISHDPADDWLTIGFAETIGAELAQLPTLSVVSLSPDGSDPTDGHHRSAQEAGRRVHASWVVAGEIQRLDQRLRVTVRLIGVAASHFSDDGDQLELFTKESDDRTRDLDRTTDEIRSKFGAGAIRRGG